ncbi:MAG: protein kinase [Acidobacteriota bacterium]
MDGGGFGPYRIVEQLGEGGMGVVYLAEHTESGERVALKTLRVPKAALLSSIRREIHVLAKLRHPGVVRVVAEGVHRGVPWYAMELLRGLTLRQRLLGDSRVSDGTWTSTIAMLDQMPTAMIGNAGTMKVPDAPMVSAGDPSGARIPLHEALGLARRLCDPLGYLHGEGIVHRDLKPENVMVACGLPVLVDFGLLAEVAITARETLDVTGEVAGTAWYMSPEQARGDAVDARSDLYALGCIVYELLTGRPPFVGESLVAILRQHEREPVAPPSSLVPEIPPAVDELILALLAKDPRDRIGYAEGAARVLDLAGADAPADEAPRPRPYLYRARFAGRAAELGAIRRALDEAREGRGTLVAIGGAAGAGKTRLALEAASGAVRAGWTVLTLPGPMALPRLVQALGDACREMGPDRSAAILGERGERGKVLAAIDPAIGELPIVARAPAPADLPADAARERLFAALTQSVGALCQAAPHLLLLDEASRAGELALAWLRHLARGAILPTSQLLVLATYRPEESSPLLEETLAAGGLTRLALGGLSDGDVELIVADMLASAAPRLAEILRDPASGNPFFVATALGLLLGEGRLGRDRRGRWIVTDPSPGDPFRALPIPASFEELVARQIALLSPESRALLGVAAVLGREESWDLLGFVSPLRDDLHLEALHELLRRSHLEEASAGRFRFVHERLYAAAARDGDRDGGVALHERIARAMETMPEDDRRARLAARAAHWERAGNPGEARPLYLAAARRAVESFAHAEAERHYRAYLALAPEASLERLAALRELAEKVLRLRGRHREERDVVLEALADARSLGVRKEETLALSLLAGAYNNLGDVPRSAEAAAEALAIAHEMGDTGRQGTLICHLGLLDYQAGRLAAGRALRGGAAAPRAGGERMMVLGTLVNLTALLQHQGEFALAREASIRSGEVAAEIGYRRGEALAIANLSTIAESLGDSVEARSLATRALEQFRAIGDRPNEGLTLANLASMALSAGEPEKARELAQSALAIQHEVGNVRLEGFTLNMLGSALQALGRLGEARAIYEKALAAQQGVDSVPLTAQVQNNLADLCVVEGDLDRAERLSLDAIAACRDIGDTRWLGKVVHRLAVVREKQGRLDDAEREAREAVRLLVDVGDRLSEIESRVLTARLVAHRDEDLARSELAVIEKLASDLALAPTNPSLSGVEKLRLILGR